MLGYSFRLGGVCGRETPSVGNFGISVMHQNLYNTLCENPYFQHGANELEILENTIKKHVTTIQKMHKISYNKTRAALIVTSLQIELIILNPVPKPLSYLKT